MKSRDIIQGLMWHDRDFDTNITGVRVEGKKIIFEVEQKTNEKNENN